MAGTCEWIALSITKKEKDARLKRAFLLLWQLFGISSFSGFGFVERLYHISQKQRQASST